MLHIAIVEDEAAERENIKSMLQKFSEENHVEIKTTEFANAIVFLTNYNPIFDLVFLDIQMEHMDGMKAAQKLRDIDSQVLLVFITNMSGMAVKGYAVDAMDFIVKPIVFGSFSAMMSKAFLRIKRKAANVIIKTADGKIRLESDQIMYIDVSGHRVVYHTEKEDYNCWGTLKEQRGLLPDDRFVPCNSYTIVNLKYVIEITGTTVVIPKVKLTLTRTRKKEFLDRLLTYYGENI